MCPLIKDEDFYNVLFLKSFLDNFLISLFSVEISDHELQNHNTDSFTVMIL